MKTGVLQELLNEDHLQRDERTIKEIERHQEENKRGGGKAYPLFR